MRYLFINFILGNSIYTLGHDYCIKIANQALNVEESGGMMTLDGKRRRTLGRSSIDYLVN